MATAAKDFTTYKLSIISFLKSTPSSVKSDEHLDVLALPSAVPACLALLDHMLANTPEYLRSIKLAEDKIPQGDQGRGLEEARAVLAEKE